MLHKRKKTNNKAMNDNLICYPVYTSICNYKLERCTKLLKEFKTQTA